MSDLTPYTFEGHDVRTLVAEDGTPLFVLADVCRVLDIANPWNVAKRLDADDLHTVEVIDSMGRTQHARAVTESGVIDVTLDSRKPEARKFRRWLTHEVVPQIARTGSYGVEQVKPLTPLEYAERLVDAERRALEGQHFKTAIEAGDGLILRAFHKKYFPDVPERDFFDHLYTKGYLINQRGKGSLRVAGPKAGTYRDGSQHRHPSYKGKPFLYLHARLDRDDQRREATRVRPGDPEIAFRDRLISEGLPPGTEQAALQLIEAGA